MPQLLPWLRRFLRAGSDLDKIRRIARAMRPLVRDCPTRHARLAAEAGVPDLIVRAGMLYVYPTYADFMREAVAWSIRRENGIHWLELGPEELRQREPMLDRRYGFGVVVDGSGQCRDPGGYVAALARHAQARGAALLRANATGFDIAGGRLRAVRTSGGDIACDRAVIAAGARAKMLARAAGDDVPLESERGYHTMIAGAEAGPRHLTMPSDGKMVHSAMRCGLRVAGQVEFAGLDAAPDWRRADILRQHLLRSYPDLPRDLPAERVRTWMGHRPSLPDSLPCIGPASGCADVIHAYGHGHIGLAAGPVTGRLVADLIGGLPPTIDPAPYRPQRFRG